LPRANPNCLCNGPGGFAPIIATALACYLGGTAGVSLMLIALALITFVATLFAKETKGQSLVSEVRSHENLSATQRLGNARARS
jgi:hypothetical protein